jgi:hypothetical protein
VGISVIRGHYPDEVGIKINDQVAISQ